MIWDTAENAAKGRPAPKEVQHLRRLNKVVGDNSAASVSDAGWTLVPDCTQNALIEQQALQRLKALRDSAQRYGFGVLGGLGLWLFGTRGFGVMVVGYWGVWLYGCGVQGGLALRLLGTGGFGVMVVGYLGGLALWVAHSQRVAQGALHDWKAVNESLRGTPKPHNWVRLPEPVPPMKTEVMRRNTMGDSSPGLDGIGKPL